MNSYITYLAALGAALSLSAPLTFGQAVAGSSTEFVSVDGAIGWGGLPNRIRHVPSNIVLVLIPPGSFTMGSPTTEAERDADEVQRAVVIDKPFYMGETEVTIEQWKYVYGTLPLEMEHTGSDSLPVSGVSWYKAKEYISSLNKMGASVWRLPTENEWEYACRAGTGGAFSFAAKLGTDKVNFNGKLPYDKAQVTASLGQPVPAKSLPANPWGLHEMHGNVWEWCEDLYFVHPELMTAKDVQSKGVLGASRVVRGGAWTSKGGKVRCANRDGYPPSASGAPYGFRLVASTAAIQSE